MKTGSNIFIPIAWSITLLVSMLPDILFRELTGGLPAWLFWTKLGLMLSSWSYTIGQVKTSRLSEAGIQWPK